MRVVAVCLLLCSLASAQSKNVIESVKADRDTALELNPNADFWRGARVVYAEVGANGDTLSDFRTEVRSRWTGTYIYFLFVCPYHHLSLKPNPDTTNETYELWNWNVAEVFIGSDFKDIKHYKEFEVSPQNEWIDLDIDLHNPHHEKGWVWNSDFGHAARIDQQNHIWYAAMRIPFTALTAQAVRGGATFRVNFYRTEGAGADARQIMWQPVMSSTFHVPERFGLLRLVAK